MTETLTWIDRRELELREDAPKWLRENQRKAIARLRASTTARPFMHEHLYTQANVRAWTARLIQGRLSVADARGLLCCLTHDGLPKPMIRWDDLARDTTTPEDIQGLIDGCMAVIHAPRLI